MSASETIEEFAKALIVLVRDVAIRSLDATVAPQAHHDMANRWKKIGATEDILNVLVPDIVDDTIFYLLDAIDNGTLELFVRHVDGELVPLSHEGRREMAGWFIGHDGWRAKYSQERFNDDFSDIT